MDPAELDEDARGKLQRQALGNVRGLVEKLDNKDALDRRTEKKFMIAGGAVTLAAIAAMIVAAMARAPDPGAEARARCIQEARVAAMWQLKKELKEQHPDMNAAEIDKRVEIRFNEMKSVATAECAGGARKGS